MTTRSVIDNWDDIEPISMRPKTPVMKIRYTKRFDRCFSYFRAVLARDELSERSFQLTSECIDLLPSNFSVWYFRRRCLKKLVHHLPAELAFVDSIILDEPKNYQVWHHRKTICEWVNDGRDEKRFTGAVFDMDEKNFHAWQHRQWAISYFDLWDGELEFTTQLIENDVRNNSAWNHRFFVVKSINKQNDSLWLKDELEKFIENKIETDQSNESSWSYLRGLLKLAYQNLALTNDWSEKYCWKLYNLENCRSAHLLSMLISIIQEKLSTIPQPDLPHSPTTTDLHPTQDDTHTSCDNQECVDMDENDGEKNRNKLENRDENRQILIKQAQSLCEELKVIDKIRHKYWQYIYQSIV